MTSKYAGLLMAAMAIPCLAQSTIAAENKAREFHEMVSEGTANLDFRYRFEGVDQDGFDKDAKASTLRSRLTLTTASFHGFTAKFEADDVTNVGPNDYNSTENGKTEYPVVADPEGTELNQAWLQYQSDAFAATVGRQRILLGSQRFVGGVGWRQNEQTFDGVRTVFTPASGLSIDLSYVYKVNRIFGPNDGTLPADWEGDNYLLRADYTLNENHKLTGFGYLIDVDEQGGYASGKTVNNSTDTYGVAYSGTLFNALSLSATYATQSSAGASELDYDADYYMAEAGFNLGGFKVKASYEVLAADNSVGFKTPLATAHKFQGWADKFLSTPDDGIEDAYVSIAGNIGPVKVAAIYHDFQAESSSEDWGSEIDLEATWPILKYLTLGAKFASFDGNSDAYSDTDKLWLTAQLKL